MYTKFRPAYHIKGKIYDLTQENMQAMIKEIERQNHLIDKIAEVLNDPFLCNCSDGSGIKCEICKIIEELENYY